MHINKRSTQRSVWVNALFLVLLGLAVCVQEASAASFWSGSLRVTIQPSGAVSAGAQWRVDGGVWRSSGTTVSGLTVGTHAVSFSSITGWSAPANLSVRVNLWQTTSATGTYTAVQQTGSLLVNLEPAGAVSAGAQWQVDGGSFQNSGATVTGLSAGTHTVAFKAVTNYTSPANQSVSVSANTTTTLAAVYVVQTGALTVSLLPAGAVTAGAQWQVDGGSLQNSGATVSGLSVGSHAVAFKALSGWSAPAGQQVSIVANQTSSLTATYALSLATVPNLVGLAESSAAGTLTASGLVLGTTARAYSPSVPQGSVSGQNPAAATQVAQGTAVNIVVSLGSGPQTIYVSSSTGNDTLNHGLSADSPLKTLAQAVKRLRAGSSDSMLLKRGDVWNESLNGGKSSLGGGLSEAEPMVIASYGTGERPGVTLGFGAWGTTPTQYLVIRGIHFFDPNYDGTNSINGITMGPVVSLVVEDCFLDGVPFVAQAGTLPVAYLTLRRCVIADNYGIYTVRHSQGVYCDGVNGITIEDCLLDHNGWKEGVVGAEPTMFNHNVYIQTNCTDVVFRRNLSTRASSHGIQARPGGIIEDNVFCQDPIAILWRGYQADSEGRINGNVVLQGNDIGSSARGWGIDIYNSAGVRHVEVANNIIANYESILPYGFGIELIGAPGYSATATFASNIIYNWRNPISFSVDGWSVQFNGNELQDTNSSGQSLIRISDAANGTFSADSNTYSSDATNNIFYYGTYMNFEGWLSASGETNAQVRSLAYADPGRSLASYHASLGREGTLEAFLEEARKQSDDNWREEYTAAAVIAYIKAGFALVPR